MPSRPLAVLLTCLLFAACSTGRGPDVIYLPTATDVVDRMLALARVGPDDMVYDLGCGDGRIVIAAVARHGARGLCVDIDPARIAESRRNADTAGVTERIRFEAADLFEMDLGEASVVALYLSPALNLRLRPKLYRELRPGARVVSHNFDMGDWAPDSTVRVEWPAGTTSSVHLWILPSDVAGTWEVETEGGAAVRRYRVRFEQRHQRVSGTASAGGRTVPVEEPWLSGERLGFTLRDTLGGRVAALRFSGRVAGGEAGGTLRTDGGESRTWQARRR